MFFIFPLGVKMRMEVRIIEENVEELITMLAEHTSRTLEWDIDFMEQTLREIHTNIKRLRKMRG